MKSLILIFAGSLFLSEGSIKPKTIEYTFNNVVATCIGSKSCRACKNCKYCKHCAKNGGSCGVCK